MDILGIIYVVVMSLFAGVAVALFIEARAFRKMTHSIHKLHEALQEEFADQFEKQVRLADYFDQVKAFAHEILMIEGTSHDTAKHLDADSFIALSKIANAECLCGNDHQADALKDLPEAQK